MFFHGTVLAMVAIALPTTLCAPPCNVMPNQQLDNPVEIVLGCLAENVVDLLAVNASDDAKQNLTDHLNSKIEVTPY